MRKEVLVWGRKLELDIVYDAYEGEEILPSQINALDDFLENANEVTSVWTFFYLRFLFSWHIRILMK